MRTIIMPIIGSLLVLLVIAAPVAAALGDPAGKAAGTSVIVEYGKGKEAGLVRVTHIHYAKAAGKQSLLTTAPCSRLAGWKWTGPVAYRIQDAGGESGLALPVAAAAAAWDDATARNLFTPIPPDDGGYPAELYRWGSRDRVNLVTYGDYAADGVVAATVTWYSRATRTAVESDILFDTGYAWGDATVDPALMDLQNIATHEIGHTLGLGDLYTGSCSAVTMYGSSSEGEITKRSLESPDIRGLRQLYGA